MVRVEYSACVGLQSNKTSQLRWTDKQLAKIGCEIGNYTDDCNITLVSDEDYEEEET